MAKRINPLTKADHDRAERLKQEWRDRLASLAEAGRRFALHARDDDPEYLFIKACFAAGDGDQTALLDWLRSDRPLPDGFREYLADLISGRRFRRRQTRGRPREYVEEHARALFARMFYREWLAANRREGINDFGKRDEMRNESIRIVGEVFAPVDIDTEVVRKSMDG
jgi:hypothetical protein